MVGVSSPFRVGFGVECLFSVFIWGSSFWGFGLNLNLFFLPILNDTSEKKVSINSLVRTQTCEGSELKKNDEVDSHEDVKWKRGETRGRESVWVPRRRRRRIFVDSSSELTRGSSSEGSDSDNSRWISGANMGEWEDNHVVLKRKLRIGTHRGTVSEIWRAEFKWRRTLVKINLGQEGFSRGRKDRVWIIILLIMFLFRLFS